MNFVVKSLAQKIGLGLYIFSDMYQMVHIDEKWFYVDDLDRTYYCLEEETPLQGQVQAEGFWLR